MTGETDRPLGDPEIAVEILKLRVAELEQAIRCVAQQDSALSLLCKMDGSQVVTVTMDSTLTDAEREAVKEGIYLCEGAAGEANENINFDAWAKTAGVLRGLLERLGGSQCVTK